MSMYFKPEIKIDLSDCDGIIYIGDCVDFLKMFKSNSVDLIIIDHDWEKLINASGRSQNIAISLYMSRVKDYFSMCRKILKICRPIAVHCNWQTDADSKSLMIDTFGRECFVDNIRWVYEGGGASKNYGFAKKHDSIIVFRNKGNKKDFFFDWEAVAREITDAQKKRYNKIDPTTNKKYAIMHGIKSWMPEKTIREDWWYDIKPLKGNDPERQYTNGIPYQKPVALIERQILAYTKIGDYVLDYMAASFTTAVAANKNNRRWAVCEIVPSKALKGIDRLKGEGIKIVSEMEYLEYLNLSDTKGWELIEIWVCDRIMANKLSPGTFAFDARYILDEEPIQIKRWNISSVGGGEVSRFVNDVKRDGHIKGTIVANSFSETGKNSAVEIAAWAKLNEGIEIKLVRYEDIICKNLYYKIN